MHYYDHNIGEFAATIRFLSLEEIGIYVVLKDEYLRTGKRLACDRIANMMPPACEASLRRVLDRFFVLEDGFYVSEEFEKLLSEYAEKSSTNAENAKKGWEKRRKATRSQAKRCDSHEVACETNDIACLTNNQEPLTNNLEVPDGTSCGNSCADAHELPPETEDEPQLIEKPLKQQNCPTKEIVDSYNEILGPWLGRVREVTPSRRTAIRARWLDVIRVCGVSDRETSIVATRAYFEKIARSNFLMGRVEGAGRKWKADFDWILKSDSFTKIYEGKYDNQR